MAVKIPVPKLEKIQPNLNQGIPQQRIQAQARDYSGIIRQGTRDISELGEQGVELYTAIEDKKIGQLADQAELSYANWNEKKLIELETIKGDPSEHYEQYEKEEREYSQTLMENSSNVSPRVKRILEAKFDKMRFKRRSKVIRQRELAKQAYRSSLYDSKLKLHKDDLPISTASIKVGDNLTSEEKDNSLAEFRLGLEDIDRTILRRGIEEGTVEYLGNNNYKFKDDLTKLTYLKERSEAIANSVTVLLNEGDTKKAEFLLNEYGTSIESVAKSKLQKKLKSTKKTNGAYEEYKRIANMDAAKRSQEIEKLLKKDPELGQEVDEINDAAERRRESSRTRRKSLALERTTKQIFERMNSNNPYHGIADYKADKTSIKDDWELLDGTEREKIKKMIEAPEESNFKSVIKVQNLFSGRIEGVTVMDVTPEEFHREYISGLSKADRKTYNSLYNRFSIDTAADERARYTQASKLLEDVLNDNGYIEKDDGFYDDKDARRLMTARKDLIQYMNAVQGTSSLNILSDFVKDYAERVVKGELEEFTPKDYRAMNARARDFNNIFKNIPSNERFKLKAKYMKEKDVNEVFFTDPDFQSYIIQNYGKR